VPEGLGPLSRTILAQIDVETCLPRSYFTAFSIQPARLPGAPCWPALRAGDGPMHVREITATVLTGKGLGPLIAPSRRHGEAGAGLPAAVDAEGVTPLGGLQPAWSAKWTRADRQKMARKSGSNRERPIRFGFRRRRHGHIPSARRPLDRASRASQRAAALCLPDRCRLPSSGRRPLI
jgi:hypothetical protein